MEGGELSEEHAERIGRQILRDNALALFPQLKGRLWKRKGELMRPERGERRSGRGGGGGMDGPAVFAGWEILARLAADRIGQAAVLGRGVAPPLRRQHSPNELSYRIGYPPIQSTPAG